MYCEIADTFHFLRFHVFESHEISRIPPAFRRGSRVRNATNNETSTGHCLAFCCGRPVVKCMTILSSGCTARARLPQTTIPTDATPGTR